MTKINISEGVYSDANADYRTSYPLNYYPVAKATGVNTGYLSPTPGIRQITGSGIISTDLISRGAQWNSRFSRQFRVIGNGLYSIDSETTFTRIGDIPGSGRVSMAHSFNSQCVVTNTKAYLYDTVTLDQITDVDLGVVFDVIWVDGYYVFTDGESLIVTELTNEREIDPIKYGSSEVSPDTIVGLGVVQNEVVGFNRYTTEVFSNVGSVGFPFRRIQSAMAPVGLVGTHAKVQFQGGYAFIGSGVSDNISVWGYNGQLVKIANREIETILAQYTEDQLRTSSMDSYSSGASDFLIINLPDRQLVFDAATSKMLKIQAWHNRTPVALHPVHANGDWWVANDSGQIGKYDETIGTEFGEKVERIFNTPIIWGGTSDFIVNRLELQGTFGRSTVGKNAAIAISYTDDGLIYSSEEWLSTGEHGEYLARFVMYQLGQTNQSRSYRFRQFNDSRIAISRLDLELQPLAVR